MRIGNLDVQPIAPYLPDTPQWVERDNKARQYFIEQGIADCHWVCGIHGEKFGIAGTHIFLLDGRPEERHMIGTNKVAGFLTNYMMYVVMEAMGATHYLYLETDCRFLDGWREHLEQQMRYVPEDFDYLYVGSCCARDKNPVHVGGDVYHFPYRGEDKWSHYPSCGHCMIIAKKAVPLILKTQRDTANPADTSLMKYAFPSLNIYAILPRLATQGPDYYIPE